MKHKTLKLFLTMGLVLSLGLAFAACGESKETGNAGDQAGNAALNGKMYTVFGAPDDSLGEMGDVCLNATTGELLCKTAEGWEKTEYQSYDAKNDSFIVSYANGSVGTYSMAAESSECTHEEFGELVVIYTAQCVVPGIGVKTCRACHESFPVIIPASGHHTFGGDGYSCEVCNENHITTPQSMLQFETDANGGMDFTGETIYLDTDINLGEVTGWAPIGKFGGVFEGRGHTIINPGTATSSIALDEVIVDDTGIFTDGIAPENIHNLHVEVAIGNVGFTHQYEYGPVGGVVAEDYKVKSAGGLRAFRDEVNNGRNTFAGKTVNLTQTIDLENELFFRIGTNANNKRFSGTFNGNGFEIQNVKVASSATETAAQAMEIGEVFNTLANGGTTSVTTSVDNCLSKEAVLNYTVHNYGDLEQIYTWKDYKNGSATKDNNYAIGGERTWIVNNVAGMKLFRDRVNNLYQNYGDGTTQWQYRTYAYDTVKLAKDIDLANEPFVVVSNTFAGVFDSQGHTFTNVVTGNVSNGETLKYLAYGQIFSDYSGGTAEFDYKIVNKGDFEQVSEYTKKSGEAMYAEYNWYIHNADGMRLFSDITNSHPAWNAADRGDVPITFNFAPTITNGDTRVNHTIHMTCDIDLENVPFVRVASGFQGIFESGEYEFKNVRPTYSATDLRQGQEWGQVFVNNTQANSDIHYTVRNGSDFEQISTFSKNRGETIYHDVHDWYIHNADGMRLFSAITNAPAWNAADRGDAPINFNFAPTITNGDTRVNHTIHLTCDIDLENVPFVRVAGGFQGVFESGEYEFKNVCPTSSATDLRQVQEWGQVFVNNTQANSDIHYTVRNGSDFEQVSTFSKERGETAMYAEHNWYIYNEAGFARFAAINGSAYDWKAENRGDNPIYFEFRTTYSNVNGARVITDSHTVHLMKDLTLESFDYPNHYLNTSNKDAYRAFGGLFDGGNYTISFKGLARTGIETGRLIPAGNLPSYEKQADGSFLSYAKIINLKMSFADSEIVAKLGGYTAIYNEAGEYDKPIWRIDSTDSLTALRDLVTGGRDFKSENILLVNDLDLKDAAWSSIGTNANPFRGSFDGNHKTVSHFKISGGNYLGFFGKIDSATVSDLTLANAEISGTDHIGGLAGVSSGSTITGVTIDTLTVNGSGYTGYVGGLVGEGFTGTIKDCTVKGSNIKGGQYMGGISGQGYATIASCTVEDCIITGTSWKAGGIIGQCNEGTRTFEDLIVRRTQLIGSSDNMGMIVGFYNGTSGTVTFNRCQVVECTLVKNSGNLTGAGGFIGEYYSNGTHTATFNDCSIDGLNIEVKNGGINGVGGFIGCDYWRGYTGLTVTFNNCSVRIGTVTIADGKTITSFGAFIGDAGVNTVKYVGENSYSGCEKAIGTASGTITGEPTKND